MPYVQRHAGKVVGIFEFPQPGYAEEFLNDSDPEVIAYRNPNFIPQTVTRFQARAALLNTPSLHEGFANMLEEVEAFMASDQVEPLARLGWTDAQEFKRTSPTIQALAPLLDLSNDDLDQLFIAASGIDA